MTQLLEHAVETVRALSPDMQDALARVLLQFVEEDTQIVQLSAEEDASFAESFAQAEQGAFANDEQISAIWAKHGL